MNKEIHKDGEKEEDRRVEGIRNRDESEREKRKEGKAVTYSRQCERYGKRSERDRDRVEQRQREGWVET